MWRDFAVILQLHVLQTNNGSRVTNEGKNYKAKDVVEYGVRVRGLRNG